MGHNVDLSVFGLKPIMCDFCNKELDISEVDIDCDIDEFKTKDGFFLTIQCNNCEKTNEKAIIVREIRDSEN